MRTGPEATKPEGSTRERLLEAGIRLFAERGFKAVSVGDIEQAVGLVPRRGALYRHFASKEALLAAAVETYLASVAEARAEYAGAAVGEGASARDVGAFILAEMDRQQQITQVLERDGDRLVQLRDRFRDEVSDQGYRGMAEILRAWIGARSERADEDAIDGLAVLLLGALVNVRRSTWTLGAAPLGLDDDALLDSWAELCEATVATGGRS
ncbi:AcrR family transcriptional regulator [Nocardioides thalensis]|uniref:AcrR family transcriptional regulator n=1 Tax=Nocardioides thalensis TaxID=1914755 RepID=A0A853CA22_9ACTN|nr:AcrR family transcriptional regulator [Nocardioides thalensis]